MNKLVNIIKDITLTTGDTFVESSTITLPSISSGIIIAKVSGIGNNSLSPVPEAYVGEVYCRYQKDDNGTLSLGTSSEYISQATMLPRVSIVNNSNNIRLRFTRNGNAYDSNWIADVEIFYIR